MGGPLPVKGTEISSAPCSVQRAAGLLRRFLSSEAGAEVGIAKGYIEAVAQSLEEMLARRTESGTEGPSVTTSGRISKFFNLEQMQKVPEVKKKKKSRKEKDAKESKQQQKDQAMVDFEALLGHELDGAEANGFEEKSAVTETTPYSVDESQKRQKKKRKSLVGGETLSDPDVTKSTRKEKKKKKRKSVDGAVYNGLGGDTPAKAIKVEESADEDMNDNSMKKKKKHSIVADSEVQQGSSAKKKSKKRASEESPVVEAFHL